MTGAETILLHKGNTFIATPLSSVTLLWTPEGSCAGGVSSPLFSVDQQHFPRSHFDWRPNWQESALHRIVLQGRNIYSVPLSL